MVLSLDTLFPRGEDVAHFSLDEPFTGESPDSSVTVISTAIDGTAYAEGKLFRLTGELIFRYETECARCLAPVSAFCTAEFDEEFGLTEDEENPDRYLYKGQILDLTQMVKDCIALNMPLRTLCREDCKGLCPVCGADRNTVSCGCKVEETPIQEVNYPFAALAANLREENEEV